MEITKLDNYYKASLKSNYAHDPIKTTRDMVEIIKRDNPEVSDQEVKLFVADYIRYQLIGFTNKLYAITLDIPH